MLPIVNVGTKPLADYATISGRGLMAEIQRLAGPLEGKRVCHVSATAFGGGVAEINYKIVPLLNSAGLHTARRTSGSSTRTTPRTRRSSTRPSMTS